MNALKKKGPDQLKFVLHKLKFGLHSQIQVDRVLLVLAPFNLPTETDKALVLEKSKEWCHQVGPIFDCSQQQEALDRMLNFDLMETVAGQQLHDMGHEKGLLESVREDVLEILEERFGIVPNDMNQQIRTISQREYLKQLHKQAIRCPDLDHFNEMLLKAVSPPKQ